MKILTISNYYPEHAGGIEFVALNLVRQWRERHTVRWMACDVGARPHVSAADDIPLPAINFTEERLGFPYPFPFPSAFSQIFKQVRWCDLVHIHDCLYSSNVFAFLAARWHKKPLVVTQHVGPVPYTRYYKNLLQQIAYGTLGKLILRNASRVVFINQRVKDWFETQNHFQRSGRLVPNGVDHKLFHPAGGDERRQFRAKLGFPDGQVVVLFVGRFTEKKGLHLLQQVAETHPDLLFQLVGIGESHPEDWALPNIRVLPPQSQMLLREFYVAADVFFLPSVGEGFPLAVQEALSCGLPAAVSEEISAFLPGAPLIPLEVSDISAVTRSLDGLLTNPDHLSNLAKESVEYARRWDWGAVAADYEHIFEQILSEDSR